MKRSVLRGSGLLVALATAFLTLGAAGPALAQEDVRVFQQKPFLRRERVELVPVGGLSVNDAMVEHYTVGATVNYHFTETWAAGLSYWKTFGSETDLYEKVQTDYSLLPRILKTDALMTAQVSYALLYGKFALFNTWVAHYDTYLQLGVGAAQTSTDSYKPTADWGLGQRYFLLDWLSFNWELRHYMFYEDSLYHDIMLVAGVGVFVPFGFDYRMPK